jgi:general secretion pathway protein C
VFLFSSQFDSLHFLRLLHHNAVMLQRVQASSKSLWPAFITWVLGAAAAYSVVTWGLQIHSESSAPSTVPVAQGASEAPGPAQLGSSSPHIAVALGAPRSVANQNAGPVRAVDHQWTLLGVVANASGQGSALLAVDGQPAKAFLPGQSIAPGWVLHSVGHRLARLAPSLQDTPTVTLELPKTGN